MVQRLSDVGHEILHVLKTNGQTQQMSLIPWRLRSSAE